LRLAFSVSSTFIFHPIFFCHAGPHQMSNPLPTKPNPVARPFPKRGVAFALLLWLSVACAPQLEIVPVTRIVEMEVTRPVLLEATVVVTLPVPVTVEVPVEVEVTRLVEVAGGAELPGTAVRPYQILLLPNTPAGVAEVRGQQLLAALQEATGYEFVLVVPEDDTAVIETLCTATQETIAILPPEQYPLASDACNAQLALTATRFDVPYQLGMLVVPADSDITSIDDLQGKTVAIPSLTDFATYAAWLTESGATVQEVGTSSAALLALLAGEVDAATAVYNPPILPFNARPWEYTSDDPELWRTTGRFPFRDPVGYVDVLTSPEQGGYRLRDARAALFDTNPTIFQDTRIIALSPPVPYEAIVFSPDFSLTAAPQISAALQQFTTSPACATSLCASDFYQWTGTEPLPATAYDLLRPVLAENAETENE
jgi:ABC-type phosphate/phosphonate transport system substrate-binding protein